MSTYYVTTGGNNTTGDGSLGNPWATPDKGVSTMAGGDTLFIAAGAYTLSATLTPPTGSAAAPTRIVGYNATASGSTSDLDGDATMSGSTTWPVLTVPAATYGFTISNAHVRVRNLIIDCAGNSGTRGYYVASNGLYPHVKNCKVRRFTQYGFLLRGPARAVGCWATEGTSAATGAYYTDDASTHFGCRASANACPGFYQAGAGAQYVRCLSHGNTGTSSDGFISTGTSGGVYLNCVAYGNARDGIRLDGSADANVALAFGNILVSNTGYGLKSATTNLTAFQGDYNAFYSSPTQNYSQVPAGAHDIVLAGDPFTASGSGDFSLTGAGLTALKGTGYPGAFPGAATTGYADVGAAQHQDSGGGGGASFRRVTMDGGF